MDKRYDYGIFSREVAGETQYFVLFDMARPYLNGKQKYPRLLIFRPRWYEENGEIIIDDDYIQQQINNFYQNNPQKKNQ